MEQAHDSVVWSIDWHPLGHILASGSNDHTVKFFTRNRLGDKMIDKYNLNLMPKGQEGDDNEEMNAEYDDNVESIIPGLGFSNEMSSEMDPQAIQHQQIMQQQQQQIQQQRKVPFAKRINQHFENQWSNNKPMNQNKRKINNLHNNNNMRYQND